jgi:cytidylate kinase
MTDYAHVAIDGPVASGKTTVARALAQRLGILSLDTGAMYRGLAALALAEGADVTDEAALLELARQHPIAVRLDGEAPLGFRIFAGARELGAELFSNDVSTVVSAVARHAGVRREMVNRQRAIAAGGPVVMAGRDIGTVVLPDAPLKVFLTASVDARVKRRLAELGAAGAAVDPNVLRVQIAERDRLDETREASPLHAAADAIVIDSSDLGVEEVVARIAALAGR